MVKKSEEKFNRLMEKAEELFMKYGYKSISMDQIANEAGISKMTIYKHFSSKEDIFIEVLMNYTKRHFDVIMDNIKEKYHPFEKIESLYGYMMELSNQVPFILYKDIMERPYVMEKVKDYKNKITLSMWRHILEDGIEKGEIRPLNVEFISNFLLDLPEIVMKPYYLNEEKGRPWLFENLFDFLKYGLLGGKENENDKERSNEDWKHKKEL